MAKKPREFIDESHSVSGEYYDLLEGLDLDPSEEEVKRELRKLILKDHLFLDPYLILYDILMDEEEFEEGERLLDRAFGFALELVCDQSGNWPDLLQWGFMENRHIIRTFLNKAEVLWSKFEFVLALDLYRKLLRTDLNDKAGVRMYILALKMGLSFEEFEKQFNRGGHYDSELNKWFNQNYKKFPEEFAAWEKIYEQSM